MLATYHDITTAHAYNHTWHTPTQSLLLLTASAVHLKPISWTDMASQDPVMELVGTLSQDW